MTTNDKYHETEEGFFRNEKTPDVKRSRLHWSRLKSLEEIRRAISDLREKQNQRNEQYRRSHGG
jgi:hypothetical protein